MAHRGDLLILAGCLTIIPTAAQSQNERVMARLLGAGPISGYWQGTYTASQIPHQSFPITLVFHQSGRIVTGGFVTSTGVYGSGTGSVSGSSVTITWRNSTPQCPGRYQGTYRISGNTMTWSYTGRDCLGVERGSGSASRQ